MTKIMRTFVMENALSLPSAVTLAEGASWTLTHYRLLAPKAHKTHYMYQQVDIHLTEERPIQRKIKKGFENDNL